MLWLAGTPLATSVVIFPARTTVRVDVASLSQTGTTLGFVHGAAAAPVDLDLGEVTLLQACVGFQAKSQTHPSLRNWLWCKLKEAKSGSSAVFGGH